MHQILGNVIIIYSEVYKQWFIAKNQEVDKTGCSQSDLIGYGKTREEALEMALENISVSHQKQEKIIRYLNKIMEEDSEMECKMFDISGIIYQIQDLEGYDFSGIDHLNSICFDNGKYEMGAL